MMTYYQNEGQNAICECRIAICAIFKYNLYTQKGCILL